MPNKRSGSIRQRSVRTIAAVAINFAQLGVERSNFRGIDEIDLVQKQDVRAFDLQAGGVTQLGEANEHVRVDD